MLIIAIRLCCLPVTPCLFISKPTPLGQMRAKSAGNKERYEKSVTDFLAVYGYLKAKSNVRKIL